MAKKKRTPLDNYRELVEIMMKWLKNSLIRASDECKLGEIKKCLARIMNEEAEKIEKELGLS